MVVTKEVDVNYIRKESWSGARNTIEYLTNDQIETVFSILEDYLGDKPMTETELNDFFWFEDETIAEWLGFDSFDDLMDDYKSNQIA